MASFIPLETDSPISDSSEAGKNIMDLKERHGHKDEIR